MTLDDVLDRALAERPTGGSSKCMTCQLVRAGMLSNEKLAESVEALGAPKAAAVLRAAGQADVPSGDAIRRHLANHVA
jgi:hypothetical protein